jgi:hypothetical protein
VSASLVDGMETPWQVSSSLWSLSTDATADATGRDGLGMVIRAAAGAESDPAPSAQRTFTPPLDLREAAELRFWLRSSRPADGSATRPFYLAFEATTEPAAPGAQWRRFLEVRQPDLWTLQRLWLDDMPADLRQAVGVLRMASLDATIAFDAAVDDLLAVRPEAVSDVDAALLERFDGMLDVPAILDLPESPGSRTPPFILITPWSVLPLERRTGTDEVVDNHTDGGAFVRPAPAHIQLEYRVDAVAGTRAAKARLVEAIVSEVLTHQRLIAANAPVTLEPFVPSSEEAATIEPGRTPLFVRVTNDVETGARRRLDYAVPFVLAGPSDGREAAELTSTP